MSVDREKVLWEGRPSWRGRLSIIAPGTFLAVAILVAAFVFDLSLTTALLIALAVMAVTIVWGLLETVLWKYTITSERVFVRHGLISVKEQTARLERVQDLTLRQSVFDRIFGVGTLEIDTAGSEGGALEFKALTDPAAAREVLENAIRRDEREV